MGTGYKHGAGGVPLNLKVVGGTTAPANPKENTVWVNTAADITSWDFSATEPLRRSANKNLLVYPFDKSGTETINGLTYTIHTDGTITVNGTSTAGGNLHFIEFGHLELPPGAYYLSGCPVVEGQVSLTLQDAENYTGSTTYSDNRGKGKAFTLQRTTKFRVYTFIAAGITLNNAVFKPQLERGTAKTSFVKGDATGQVWISTSTTSPAVFNALKKNGIHLCPISAKQYLNGAWVAKTAQKWNGGEWDDFVTHLYTAGNEHTDLTGGFVASGKRLASWDVNISQAPTITRNADSIKISSSASQSGILYTKNKIDLSGYSKLIFDGYMYAYTESSSSWVRLCVWSSLGTYWGDNVVAEISSTVGSAQDGVFELDVSNLNGEYYIGFGIYYQYNSIIVRNLKLQ